MRERRFLGELESLDVVYERDSKQRLEPPLHPKAAVFDHILLLARGIIYREAKERRRSHVLKEFERRVIEIERSIAGCKSLGEQQLAANRGVGA